MSHRQDDTTPSRRNLLKRLSLLPVAAVANRPAFAVDPVTSTERPTDTYRPSFFSGEEWAFVVSASDRLIPHDDIGPGAVELGVPEFLDLHMQTPYASGAIWYMRGPFLEAAPEFGYQGRLAPRDILRVGIKAVDDYCAKTYSNQHFANLDHGAQETVLKGLESGGIKLAEISAKVFFTQFLGEVRMGYFADPHHGGNRGMGSWKMIGYPGVRADYTDWVEVRDRPYPIPPVDLAGRRS